VGDAAAPTIDRSPQLVGRDAELIRVAAFASGLHHGARALVVVGEPGIGKTALWRHGVEACRDAGHLVLVTRPAEEEMPLATVGLVDLFEHVGVEVAAVDGEDAFARGRAVLGALRGLVAARPVVVAVDDVQWLDSASARALRYALRRLDGEPVGLLVTARRGADAEDALAATSALPPGRCEAIELGPLSLGALRRVLDGVVDAISRPALSRIHAASGGNPLYAIELARALPSTSGFLLPESLHAAIVRRLEAAPPQIVPLLEAASALGPTSVQELRETVAGLEVDELLTSAAEHGLLAVEEDLGVRFAHPLLGSAVYARMSPLARRALHASLAARAGDPDVRARHLALSTDEPDGLVSAQLEAAAGRAAVRGAPELAAEFAGHALRMTPANEREAARRLALAQIQHLAAAGEVRQALMLSDRLVASLGPCAARVEALVQRAELEDDDRATAEEFLLGALEDAGGDERLRGRVLHRLAQLRRLRLGDVRGAIACAREALELAERVGDSQLEANAAAYLAHLETMAGTPRLELMDRAVRLEEEGGSMPLSVGPRSLLAKHRLWAGDLAAARAELELAQAAAVQAGNEMKRPQHFYDLTLVECASGNLAVAEEVVRAGIEAALDAENTYAERELLYPLALVQALRGRSDEAASTVARLREEARRHGLQPMLARAGGVLGHLFLSAGETAAAARELEEAARMLAEMGFAHPGAFPLLPDAIEALAGSGRLDEAGELLRKLERQAEEVDSSWAHALAGRAGGVLALCAGEPEAAARALAQAEDQLGGLGYRIDGARAELAHGLALVRAARRARAADVLADARDRFAGMGAELWEARAVEALERASPGRAGGKLTSAERRVAALVAEGMKNREIAQALYMSVATVEAHLTRIYRKLRIRSRSDLARLVAEGSVAVSTEP
jgi:DNA-binding CsgD family transcriptional regulator